GERRNGEEEEKCRAQNPPRHGEGDHPQDGGGGPSSSAATCVGPLHHFASLRGSPPRSGEDLKAVHYAPVRIRSTSCFTVGIEPFEEKGSLLKRKAEWPANMRFCSTGPPCAIS